MRLILNMVLIAILSYVGTLSLPWWIVVVVSALVCVFVRVNLLQAFISGFLGVGLLWFFLAWKIHTATEGILSLKITHLFGLSDPLQLIILTALVGGIAGGLAAMSGSALRNTTQRRKKEYPWTYL